MTCSDKAPKFRLLDPWTGWGDQVSSNLGGLTDNDGLRIQNSKENLLSAADVAPYFSPPWLARGSRPGEWFLLTPPIEKQWKLLRRDSCDLEWFDLGPRLLQSADLDHPEALAFHGRTLAILDALKKQVMVWFYEEGRIGAYFDVKEPDPKYVDVKEPDTLCFDSKYPGSVPIDVKEPGPMAFAPWGELLIVSGRNCLLRFSPTGDSRGEKIEVFEESIDLHGKKTKKPASPIRRMAPGKDGALWFVTGESDDGPFDLWRVAPDGLELKEPSTRQDGKPADIATPDEQEYSDPSICHLQVDLQPIKVTGTLPPVQVLSKLRNAIRPGELRSADASGFCIEELIPEGGSRPLCFTRDGKPTSSLPETVGQPGKIESAQYTAFNLDSGITHCAWHRVRIEADIPWGTALTPSVLASDEPFQSARHPDSKFPPPLPQFWQQENENTLDFLIRQPPGQYLNFRLDFKGTASASPKVKRVRIDYPRQTSLNQLPVVFRSDPDAEDFTDRFMALFDSVTEDLDRSFEGFASLLSAESIEEGLLPWLENLFDIVRDPDLDVSRRREILKAMPKLLAKRGTIDGLRLIAKIAMDVDLIIEDEAQSKALGVLGKSSRLGSTRLFGKSQSRFRLGRSLLGSTPIRSFGDPELDPLVDKAFRVTIKFQGNRLNQAEQERFQRLLKEYCPAHVHHLVQPGGPTGVVGTWSSVGIDTMIAAPPIPILGSRSRAGSAQLNRTSILRPGRGGRMIGFRVARAAVGVNTILE